MDFLETFRSALLEELRRGWPIQNFQPYGNIQAVDFSIMALKKQHRDPLYLSSPGPRDYHIRYWLNPSRISVRVRRTNQWFYFEWADPELIDHLLKQTEKVFGPAGMLPSRRRCKS